MDIKYYDCVSLSAIEILKDHLYDDLNTVEVRDLVACHVGFVPERCILVGDTIFAVKEKWETKYVLPYEPVCPFGYTDCINDPAYIKWYHPDWYQDIYGKNIKPDGAIRINGCMTHWKNHLEDDEQFGDCPWYDDEDK